MGFMRRLAQAVLPHHRMPSFLQLPDCHIDVRSRRRRRERFSGEGLELQRNDFGRLVPQGGNPDFLHASLLQSIARPPLTPMCCPVMNEASGAARNATAAAISLGWAERGMPYARAAAIRANSFVTSGGFQAGLGVPLPSPWSPGTTAMPL